MSSRKRKPNSRDPRRPRPRRDDIHATPADYAPILIERDLGDMAAEAGTTEAECLAGLDRIEAARHLVRMHTDDPSVVRFWPVFPDQYDRMRARADFLESPEGRELMGWVDDWHNDPDLDDDAREAFKAITVAIIDGNGTGQVEGYEFAIGGDRG